MKRFFIINGEAQTGKDTFVSLCQDVVKTAINESDVIWNYSMVDKIKQIAKECGWDGEKTPEARKFLSDLKDLCDEFAQTSYKSVKDKVDEFLKSPTAEILFIHAREPKDIERLKKEYGAKTILIMRDNHKTNATNHADANVYDYHYDIIIMNPGTNLELYRDKANQFLSSIGYFDANIYPTLDILMQTF